MLATDIAESKTGVVYPDGYHHDRCRDGILSRLKDAPKFVLDAQACAMAASVALSKPSSILSALVFTKLPFDRMWIEFANADTRKAMSDLGSPNKQPPATAVTIERSGFLLENVKGGIRVEYVHTDRIPSGARISDLCPVVGTFSLKGLEEGERQAPSDIVRATEAPKLATGRVQQHIGIIHSDPDEAAADMEIRTRFTFVPHPDMERVRRNMVARMGEASVSAIEENQGLEMFRLFSLQVLPALILLNCRNAVDLEKVDAPAKLNKHRIKKGKSPIPEHVVVKVHLSPTRRRVYEATGRSREAARGSLVIGHFKVRKSGIYWWSPHWRGNPATATTDRTYILTR